MTRWDRVLFSMKLQEAGVEEQEEEEDGEGNISITHLTLMRCSGTLTPMPKTGTPTTDGTSRTTCGPTSRHRGRGRDAISATSRVALGPACLMTCLTTWRRCSPSTGSRSGLKADSRARANSSAGQ